MRIGLISCVGCRPRVAGGVVGCFGGDGRSGGGKAGVLRCDGRGFGGVRGSAGLAGSRPASWCRGSSATRSGTRLTAIFAAARTQGAPRGRVDHPVQGSNRPRPEDSGALIGYTAPRTLRGTPSRTADRGVAPAHAPRRRRPRLVLDGRPDERPVVPGQCPTLAADLRTRTVRRRCRRRRGNGGWHLMRRQRLTDLPRFGIRQVRRTR